MCVCGVLFIFDFRRFEIFDLLQKLFYLLKFHLYRISRVESVQMAEVKPENAPERKFKFNNYIL